MREEAQARAEAEARLEARADALISERFASEEEALKRALDKQLTTMMDERVAAVKKELDQEVARIATALGSRIDRGAEEAEQGVTRAEQLASATEAKLTGELDAAVVKQVDAGLRARGGRSTPAPPSFSRSCGGARRGTSPSAGKSLSASPPRRAPRSRRR